MAKLTNALELLELREQGLTYQQIADRYGVSRQAVAQKCAQYSPHHFRHLTEKDCIYPNLRKWMNDNKCGKSELARRLELVPIPNNVGHVRKWLTGTNMSKHTIDKFLAVTGLTYEELFYKEDNDEAEAD